MGWRSWIDARSPSNFVAALERQQCFRKSWAVAQLVDPRSPWAPPFPWEPMTRSEHVLEHHERVPLLLSQLRDDACRAVSCLFRLCISGRGMRDSPALDHHYPYRRLSCWVASERHGPRTSRGRPKVSGSRRGCSPSLLIRISPPLSKRMILLGLCVVLTGTTTEP